MQKMEIGPRIHRSVIAGATLTFTPLFDRAAIITDIQIVNPSANDNWLVTVGGREIMRFRILTVGNQQLLSKIQSVQPRANRIFDFAETVLGTSMRIPVPNGISCVIASAGGATANVLIEAMEVDITDTPTSLVNHYLGNTFIAPTFGFFNGTPVVGVNPLDSETSPTWFPHIFTGTEFPVGFRATILALFLETFSRNTFSGAANHVSRTDVLRLAINGQQKFGRDDTGIRLRAEDAAAGSANNVYNTSLSEYLAFQNAHPTAYNDVYPPIVLNGGDLAVWSEEISGDVTGIAATDFGSALQVALIKLEQL